MPVHQNRFKCDWTDENHRAPTCCATRESPVRLLSLLRAPYPSVVPSAEVNCARKLSAFVDAGGTDDACCPPFVTYLPLKIVTSSRHAIFACCSTNPIETGLQNRWPTNVTTPRTEDARYCTPAGLFRRIAISLPTLQPLPAYCACISTSRKARSFSGKASRQSSSISWYPKSLPQDAMASRAA